jgi:hypothetical protein
MTFSLAGKNRPNKPDAAVLDAIQGAVTKALGPGYSVNVYSGKEHPGKQTGSNRHKTGLAADVHIIGPDGKTLNAKDNKQQMLDVAAAFKGLGGMGIGLGTDYMGGVGIHLDMFSPGPGQDSAWGNIGNAMQGWLDGFYKDPSRQQMPDVMDVPRSLAQATAIEAAYKDPFRALDTIQSRPALNMPARPQTLNPPQRLAPAPVGKVTRSALPSIPASLPAAPVGKVERAPLGPVGQFSQPARSLQHPTSVAKPTNLAAAPVGKVTKGPALAPATPNASTLAAQYGQYRPSTATSMPTIATPPSVPVGALPAAKTVAQPLQHPISVPVAPVTPPALALPPAPVLAPELVPRPPVQDRPIYQAPAPPRATAYDVYSGMADTALDNTGLNTVSSMPGGGTSVTNQYGATTGMKNGYQTAVGSLPGITGPSLGRFGGAVKGALPGMAGASLGGLLGGPVGALLGAALAKAVTKPGGVLSGQTSFDTDYFGTINAAKAKSGGAFPSAPSAPSGQRNVRGWDSAADRARGESISPGASAAIGRNQGGLY